MMLESLVVHDTGIFVMVLGCKLVEAVSFSLVAQLG